MRACNGKWAQKEVWRGKKEYCSGNSQIDRPIIQKQYHKECFAGSSLSLNCLARHHLLMSEYVEQAALPILTT